jgi:hypothetical protein
MIGGQKTARYGRNGDDAVRVALVSERWADSLSRLIAAAPALLALARAERAYRVAMTSLLMRPFGGAEREEADRAHAALIAAGGRP